MDKRLFATYFHPLSPIPTGLEPKGTLQHDIDCVLFDLYGTLFISDSGDMNLIRKKSDRLQLFQKLLQASRIEMDPQALIERLTQTIEWQHQQLVGEGVDYPEVQIDDIWMMILPDSDRKRIRRFAVEFELIMNPVYPMPSLQELLKTCRDSGVKMGIVSNAQFYTPLLFNWFLDASTAELGFDPKLTVYSYEYGYAKPSSGLFAPVTTYLDQLGISRRSVLFLGNDMLNDILPAQKAGFCTALFAGDSRSLRLRKNHPACNGIRPDLVITDLKQLIRLIRQKL